MVSSKEYLIYVWVVSCKEYLIYISHRIDFLHKATHTTNISHSHHRMHRRRKNVHLLLLLLTIARSITTTAATSSSSTTQRRRNIEDDLGLERRPFDDSLKHSSRDEEVKEENKVNEELLDYHDAYRDHSHDHEHLEEGERVVRWEL